jgi:hypothetical protein
VSLLDQNAVKYISAYKSAIISFYWKQIQDFVELFHVAGRHVGENLEGEIIFLFANFNQFLRKPRGKKTSLFMNKDVQLKGET